MHRSRLGSCEHTVENGGPLTVERVAFTPGRGNVIITYPGETDESLAFVNSHMDLVPVIRRREARPIPHDRRGR